MDVFEIRRRLRACSRPPRATPLTDALAGALHAPLLFNGADLAKTGVQRA